MKIAWEESPITNTNKRFNELMDNFEQPYEKSTKCSEEKIQTTIQMELEKPIKGWMDNQLIEQVK